MINNVLLTEMAKALNNESYDVPSFIAFSSTTKTLSPSDATLGGELDRSSLSLTRVGTEVTFYGIRSGTSVGAGGDYINSVGLFPSSTSSTVMVESLVPSVLHTSTYDLETSWKVSVERK